MKFPTIWGCAYVFTYDALVQTCRVSPRHSVFELCENITVSFCFYFGLVNMADEKDPHAGVTVKMSNGDRTLNCSLAVSVICDSSGVQVRACFFDV